MNGTSSFGESYAVLNLDWMTILVNGIKDEPEGAALIANWSKWNDAVHQKPSRPLSIFVTLAFSPGQPELDPNSPFANLIASYGKFIAGSPEVQVDKRFKIDEQDLIVQKTRLSASIGNSLEQILKAKGIKTVIISGLSLSGVVMATIYRLFDLDYHIYVIRDNVMEIPIDHTPEFSNVMLDKLLPKMECKVISLDEALKMLELS